LCTNQPFARQVALEASTSLPSKQNAPVEYSIVRPGSDWKML
jgi:hypothetical protein